MDLLLHMESNNEWLNSLQHVYSVTISKFPAAADFPIEIQGCKTNILFDAGAQVSSIPYNCYRKLTLKKYQYLHNKNQIKSHS